MNTAKTIGETILGIVAVAGSIFLGLVISAVGLYFTLIMLGFILAMFS